MWSDEFVGTPFHLNTPLPLATSAPLPSKPCTPIEEGFEILSPYATDTDDLPFSEDSDGTHDEAALEEGAPSDDEDWTRPIVSEASITPHPPVPRPFAKRRREADPYYAGLQRTDDEIFTQDPDAIFDADSN